MINISETEKEFMRNAHELKRCNKALGRAFWGFMSIGFMGLFFGLTMMVSASYDAVFLLIDSLIIYGALIWCAEKGCRKHWDFMAMLAGALPLFNALLLFVASRHVGGKIFGRFSFNVLRYAVTPTVFFGLVTLICAIVAVKNNSIFRGLEMQPGYPHFNIREMEQRADIIQTSIKSEYQQNFEKLLKTQRSDMEDIVVPDTGSSEKNDTAKNYMDEL